MRKVFVLAVLAAVCLLGAAQSQASVITVTVPDPAPLQFIFLGNGTASVTYSGVTFSSSASLSDGNLWNVGSLFSGYPAVVSSQQQTFGVANIQTTLPWVSTFWAISYGTFYGSPVTFLASNGDTATFGSTGGALGGFYNTPDGVAYNGPAISWVLITSPDSVLSVNNVQFNTPEPGTIAMLGSGLLVLGGALRRKIGV